MFWLQRYHSVGQVDLVGSFGTDNPETVWEIIGEHLDIVKIETLEASCDFDYCWTDKDYYDVQIERLKPGYDYSSRG